MSVGVATVRELAGLPPGEPVLSIHLRTDPRDPANTNHVPGWLVALRNGLRSVSRQLEEDGARDDRLALRELRDLAEREIVALDPAERGRGVAWFLGADGGLDRRLILQLAPREDVVRWDERPFVSPLVDVADRGRPTGLVLVGGDAVRLLHWEGGRVSEPERSVYELELGDWREYAAYAMSNPARGQQTATNVAAYEQRVDEWRGRFLRDSAAAVARRLGQLGWDRVVVAHEGQVGTRWSEALPDELRDRVVAEAGANVLWEEPAEVADRLAPVLEAAWLEEAAAVARRAVDAARAGGPGATGWDEVLAALAEHRVAHLVLDPAAVPEPALIGPGTRSAVGDPRPDLLRRARGRAGRRRGRPRHVGRGRSGPGARAGGRHRGRAALVTRPGPVRPPDGHRVTRATPSRTAG
jgi:hypothetical protein